MPKYKTKEFAKAYEIKEATVKSYIFRKQLQRDANGLIDTENDRNKLFILEMQLKPSSKKKVEKEVVSSSKKEVQQKISFEEKQIIDLDHRKRIAETEAKERESELKRIQLEKIAGNLMPVELVEKILVINIQSIFKNFESEMENLARVYVPDRDLLAQAISDQKELLSKIIAKTKEDSSIEIENAINEYQETRSRGERK